MSEITDILKQFSTQFNTDAVRIFTKPNGVEKRVIEAMEYAVMNGGKRLRPYLLCESASLFGVDYTTAFPAAVSLEMLHSYSLVHDDLPAMDNDDLRRGKPTCHKKYDEATAILAGDGLLTHAFEYLSKSLQIRPEIRLTLIQLLSEAAGAFGGMVAGQPLDLYAQPTDNQQENEQIIKRLEEMKTGRLLRYACEAGAVLGQAPIAERQALITYARRIGQAFQIADDILDREGDQNLVGKTLHKDDAQQKLTYVSYLGIEPARRLARQLVDEAIAALSVFDHKADHLRLLAHYIVDRKY
ncbi:MAG: polyprenyl synthetase family protein [Alphaproteobacteria bacterium]|nr:polyprenyl synthetase family protein [Alphaproteobacteria bacterium]